MISYNSSTIICLVFWVVLLFKKIDFVFYALVFSSVLTTVAVFNIGENSILFFHGVFLILFIKFIIKVLKEKNIKISLNSLFIIFIIWCGLTIPLSLLNEDVVVMNIDSKITNVQFGFQQFTQYAYLVIGFLVFFICNSLLMDNTISINTIIKIINISYVVELCLALLQLVLPVNIVNEFYRNSVNVAYSYEGARISGTYNEPSTLSLFATPLFGVYLFKLFADFKTKYLIYVSLFLVISVLNFSSSAVLGVIFALFLVIIFCPRNRNKKITKKGTVFFLVVVLTAILIIFINFDKVQYAIDEMIKKLNGEGVSGSERSSTLIYHLKVWFEHFFCGIGYGTVKSFDLFTTWGCEIGIIGLLLYFIPLFDLCVKLCKVHTILALQLLICILVYNLIMFVSVCEVVFLGIWIYYGLASYLVYSHKKGTMSVLDKFELET